MTDGSGEIMDKDKEIELHMKIVDVDILSSRMRRHAEFSKMFICVMLSYMICQISSKGDGITVIVVNLIFLLIAIINAVMCMFAGRRRRHLIDDVMTQFENEKDTEEIGRLRKRFFEVISK